MAPHDQGTDLLVTLEQIGRGKVVADGTKKLREVVRAVAEIGGKGTVTIKIEIAPLKGTDNSVGLKAKVTSTIPQPDHAALFFIDSNGDLTRDNPDYSEPLFSETEVKDGGDR